MPDSDRPIVVRPGEGVVFGNVEFLALSEHTPRFNASIITMPPGKDGPAPHTHEGEDDAFYVLEGEITFVVGEDEIVAPAGTFVLVPPDILHSFANRSEAPSRILNIHAPAGFDRRLLGR